MKLKLELKQLHGDEYVESGKWGHPFFGLTPFFRHAR